MKYSLLSMCAFATIGLMPADATVIATYPVGTILENIAVGANGNLYVTDVGNGTVYTVTPAGASSVLGTLPGTAAGIVVTPSGSVVAASGTSLYRFAPDGTSTQLADVSGAAFLNGLAMFGPNSVLAADDTANTVWKIDLGTGLSTPWLTGPLLEPAPDGLPFGPNGIKLYDGSAYISVTGAGTILRVPILGDGSAGVPQIYAALTGDDFAFGADGSLFLATQLGTIIRLYPDGTQTTISTGTFGDAAVAFGRTSGDLHDLYVVNNGGAFLDLPDGPLDASIVRLTTDTVGAPAPEPSTLGLNALVGLLLLLRFVRPLDRLRSIPGLRRGWR